MPLALALALLRSEGEVLALLQAVDECDFVGLTLGRSLKETDSMALALALELALMSALREALLHLLTLGEALVLALWLLLKLGGVVPLILPLEELDTLEQELAIGLGLLVSVPLSETLPEVLTVPVMQVVTV